MPIIRHEDIPAEQTRPGMKGRRILNKERGSATTTMGDSIMSPGAKIPLHTHQNEETIVVVEGTLDFIVGNERKSCKPISTLFAPAGVPHSIINNSKADARILTFHPVHNPQTTWLEQ